MRQFGRWLWATIGLASATPLHGQIPAMQMPPANTYPQNFLIYDPAYNQPQQQRQQSEARRPSSTEIARSSAMMLSKLDFQSNATRQARNLDEFIAKSRVGGVSDPLLEAELRSGQVLPQVSAALRQVGLRPTNMADAYAAWWINAWDAVNGQNTSVTANLAKRVRSQAASALLKSSAADLSNADKQQFAESFLIHAALIGSALEQARGSQSQERALARAVDQAARKMGLDLTAMELTPDGFVMREGASAVDAPAVPGGEAPAALAAAWADGAGAEEAGTDLSDYALPALGGTAALAAVFLLGRAAGRRG